MKLIGNLKKKVENAKTKEEARDTIKKAGMLLDDDELAKVSGGRNDDNLCVVMWSTCDQSATKKHSWEKIGMSGVFTYYECRFCKQKTYFKMVVPRPDLM